MNNVNEIKMANAKLLTEKAKLERIETVISKADHISSEFCAEGYRTYRKIKNIEADLCGMYMNQLLIVYPWFKGEALYEEAIIHVIGQRGFEMLHDRKVIQLCGRTVNGKLYTY